MADDSRQIIIQVDPAVANGIIAVLQHLVIAANKQTTTLNSVLPVVQTTSATATAGGGAALPATVFEYLVLSDPNGNSIKVPAYKP